MDEASNQLKQEIHRFLTETYPNEIRKRKQRRIFIPACYVVLVALVTSMSFNIYYGRDGWVLAQLLISSILSCMLFMDRVLDKIILYHFSKLEEMTQKAAEMVESKDKAKP